MNLRPEWANIEAAFLQGEAVHDIDGSEMYLSQPRECWPGLSPGQLLRIRTGLFRFADSPRLWWSTFRQTSLGLKIEEHNETIEFVQSSLDPALLFSTRALWWASWLSTSTIC